MPYLAQAGFWVGLIGTVVSTPLLLFLRVQASYMNRAQFFASSPLIIFLLASWSFALIYAVQPGWRYRARTAGISAALLTFAGFTLWLSIMVNVSTGSGNAWPTVWYPHLASFAIFGWLPLAGGWFAGWVVTKLPNAPAQENA
jgi:hypothetical protein